MGRAARLLAAASARLAQTSQTPHLDAQLLLAYAAGTSRARLAALRNADLPLATVHRFSALVRERASMRTPVAYLTGNKPFWTLELAVNRHTLIPRPDTETLVEAALVRRPPPATASPRANTCWRIASDAASPGVAPPQAHAPRGAPARVLDVGTGSGCVLLALLSELPDAVGVGVDVCPHALRVAARNAQRAGLASRCSFQAGACIARRSRHFSPLTRRGAADMRDLSPQGSGVAAVAASLRELGAGRGFDLVASNPPYIPAQEAPAVADSVASHEPGLALWGWGTEGIGAYDAVAALDPALLSEDPLLAVEVGAGAEDGVRSAIQRHGWRWAATQRDLAGIPRALVFRRPEPGQVADEGEGGG